MSFEQEIIWNLPWLFAFACLPMGFLIVMCKDVIALKINILMKKKKGVKLRVHLTKDNNLDIGTVMLDKDGNIPDKDKGNDKIEWDNKNAFFSKQFGIQSCITMHGAKSIINPAAEGGVDMSDGEVVDRMVKRAELMRSMDDHWLDSKEQKLLIIILVVCIIGVAMSFAGQSQIGEFIEWARPALAAMQAGVSSIPRTL